MPFGRAGRSGASIGVVLTLLLQVGCGGSDGSESSAGGQRLSEDERTALGLRLAGQAQAAAVARARDRAGTWTEAADASADRASAPQRCLHRLAVMLAMRDSGNWPSRAETDCLAGTYRGRTLDGERCALRVDRLRGAFRFQLAGGDLSVEPDAKASLLADGFRATALGTSPVQTGIEISREVRSPADASGAMREVLRLHGGSRPDGAQDLLRAEFERRPIAGSPHARSVEAAPPAMRMSCIFAA